MSRSLVRAQAALSCLAWLVTSAVAHEHHTDNIPEGSVVSPDPLVHHSRYNSYLSTDNVQDRILWTHIFVQTIAWGVLFPLGMVLGLVRSKWHVPCQTLATGLAVLGYILGHAHKGRQFAPNIHAKFASVLMLMLISQIVLGIYLRLHIERGFQGKMRRWIVLGHGILGKAMPIAAWVQMLFGGIVALGFCRADHMGQCLAHVIMGSAFIGYGIVLAILLLAGQLWLRRTNRSQEFFDSIIIAAFGFVNTFTEHHWGQPWVHNDVQHTTLGVIWWAGGLLGIWLSGRDKHGRPRRNLIPAGILVLTGWAMSSHPQSLMLSTMVHAVFGYTLMAAGFSRMIEISFVLRDRNALTDSGDDFNSFQHLPPFLLCASGFLLISVTEEQMLLVNNAGISHVSYVFLIYSLAFVTYLCEFFSLSPINYPVTDKYSRQHAHFAVPIIHQ